MTDEGRTLERLLIVGVAVAILRRTLLIWTLESHKSWLA
jgi:hypothetical protein